MAILKVVFVIIGTLIGAGFASGQEIYIFFFSYGIKGLIGIIVSSILIGITIYKTFQITKKNNTKNYKEFLDYLIKNEKIKNITNIVVNIFILASFYIMIAGFGAYLEQELGFNSIIGSTILAILCFIIFKANVEGFVKVNSILIPILIIIITFIGILNLKNIHISNLSYYLIENNNNWLITSILYASYNSVLLIPALISIKDYIKNNKNIKYISLIVTLVTITLLTIIFLFLINVDVDIKELQMPAVYSINKIYPNIKNIYGIIILISIFTTAISLGISFLKNVTKKQENYSIIATLICITSIIFSKIGFSNLVNLLYPILGVLGMLLYQQVQNIGMIIGLLPITGITLPLISYGGSSMLSYLVAFGIIMNASAKAKKLSDYVYE